MWRKILIACACAAFSLSLPAAGSMHEDAHDAALSGTQQRRVALVIGNADYAMDALRHPAHDARAMEEALRKRGFDVERHENLDRARMEAVIAGFLQRINGALTALFYFSGHGYRVGGRTLLAPLDAGRAGPASLLRKGIDLQPVLDDMAVSGRAGRTVVILDTCLNNPFGGESVPLAAPPSGTVVAYATAAGGLAAEGRHNGAFTEALLRALRAPANDEGKALQLAAAEVSAASGGRQTPAVTTAYAPYRAILPKDSAEQYELTFWESIKDSKDPADYEAYLQAYPKGRFAALAKSRMERLRAAAKPQAPAEAPRASAPPKASAPEKPRAVPKEKPEQARPAPKEKVEPAAPAPAARSEPAPPPPAKVARGPEIRDCATCPVLVSLPAGAFTMGSNTGDPSEKPAHHVSIGAPFAIGKYEVTFEQWNACVDGGGCPRLNMRGEPNTPVRDVSWDDAQQFVKWLSASTGKSYRLPTEAEWEYAARGGTATRFWWGDQMRSGYANCKDCGGAWSQDAPAASGSFTPNAFGLHDVSGSVWEWVADCWHNNFKGAPADGHAWDSAGCRERVIRGGSWLEGGSYMPASTRFKYGASVRQSQNGFRVARDMK